MGRAPRAYRPEAQRTAQRVSDSALGRWETHKPVHKSGKEQR